MRNRCFRLGVFVIAVAFALSLCVVESTAQTRNKKRSRRSSRPVVTNPTITPPEEDTGEARVVSTADEASGDTQEGDSSTNGATGTGTGTQKSTGKKTTSSDREMQKTINSLSNQVEKLNDKLTQMQENDKTHLDMERLTRAEQRSENLRQQLLDTEGRLADAQAKLEQVEYSLKPENIERAVAGYGTLRPEELRETRRRQLESEKVRVQAQIRILETTKARLETSLVTADAEVDRLRERLEKRDALQNTTTPENSSPPETGRKPPE